MVSPPHKTKLGVYQNPSSNYHFGIIMSAIDPNPSDFLADPLSSICRLERKNLLIANMIGILIVKVGLIPTQISTLGIILSFKEQNAFIFIIAGIIVYFSCAFIIYAINDFLIWLRKYQDYLISVVTYKENYSQEDEYEYRQQINETPKIDSLYKLSKPSAYLRVAFDFILPITFSLYTLNFIILFMMST